MGRYRQLWWREVTALRGQPWLSESEYQAVLSRLMGKRWEERTKRFMESIQQLGFDGGDFLNYLLSAYVYVNDRTTTEGLKREEREKAIDNAQKLLIRLERELDKLGIGDDVIPLGNLADRLLSNPEASSATEAIALIAVNLTQYRKKIIFAPKPPPIEGEFIDGMAQIVPPLAFRGSKKMYRSVLIEAARRLFPERPTLSDQAVRKRIGRKQDKPPMK